MRKLIVACAAAVPFLAGGATAYAAYSPTRQNPEQQSSSSQKSRPNRGAKQDAHDQVIHAARALRKMTSRDPKLKRELREAKGVFVLPEYGRGALVVGASGGPGVLMRRHGGASTGPESSASRNGP